MVTEHNACINSRPHPLWADGVYGGLVQEVKDVVVIDLNVGDKDSVLTVLVNTVSDLAGVGNTEQLAVV